MNILASNSKRVNIRVFLSFFLSLLASFLPSCGPLVGSTRDRSTRGSSSRELVGEDVGRWLVTMSGSWYGTYTSLFKMRYCRHHVRDDQLL
jgi:hypothetical protein